MITANQEIELSGIVREYLRGVCDGDDHTDFVDEYIPEMVDAINRRNDNATE